MKTNIVLFGFMGTGKTTVGRLLSRRLGFSLVDMDEIIESREGRPISRIFADNGEPYFRERERALVVELATKNGQVVATGGGVVLNPDNVADFSRSGLAVCLKASPEAILARVLRETHRPLLEEGDKARRILKLLAARRALYDAVPLGVDTSGLTPDEVADRILAWWEADA